jgi:hypothetical protein
LVALFYIITGILLWLLSMLLFPAAIVALCVLLVKNKSFCPAVLAFFGLFYVLDKLFNNPYWSNKLFFGNSAKLTP